MPDRWLGPSLSEAGRWSGMSECDEVCQTDAGCPGRVFRMIVFRDARDCASGKRMKRWRAERSMEAGNLRKGK